MSCQEGVVVGRGRTAERNRHSYALYLGAIELPLVPTAGAWTGWKRVNFRPLLTVLSIPPRYRGTDGGGGRSYGGRPSVRDDH